MRIWDIPCKNLCRQHLLGEHRELHCLWTFITTDKGGSYRKHPETLRWKKNLYGLYKRHEEQIKEMENRGYKHKSDLPKIPQGIPFSGIMKQPKKQFVHTIPEQIEILRGKGCECKI